MKRIRLYCLLLALVASCVASLPVWGRAAYASRLEMTRRAAAIALLDIGPVEKAEIKGAHWTYSQSSEAKVLNTLKGKLPNTIRLVGAEDFVCAQTKLTEGRCLAFLSKDGDNYVGCNWEPSLRPVSANDQLQWLMKPTDLFPKGQASLETAIKQIRQDLGTK